MEFGCKTIRITIDMMFIAHSNHNLQILSAVKHLSFPVDAWTSPNMKDFMAIMAHGITPEWKILDVLIGMPAVKGQNSRVNFADLLVDTLDKMELSNKLSASLLIMHPATPPQQNTLNIGSVAFLKLTASFWAVWPMSSTFLLMRGSESLAPIPEL
ncbi:uncharacterized protein VP01_1824g1 [Puccinia sorghi]|uniref:Uncharacterized protein n=1 Tax=Puccinia sorghi TaxID=27349 RepID=A0A0L6VE20_9BASI|nr:uncharacterized protein VP01_1824g1 [Puccinia sorghi]